MHKIVYLSSGNLSFTLSVGADYGADGSMDIGLQDLMASYSLSLIPITWKLIS